MQPPSHHHTFSSRPSRDQDKLPQNQATTPADASNHRPDEPSGSSPDTEESTRSRLLNAAGEVFAECGYENATVREICERAEANVASVNYYFQGKQGLYVEVIKFAQKFRADQNPLPQWPADTPAETKLNDFVRTIVFRLLVAEELPWQGRIMMREMLEPTQACRELTEHYIRPHHQMLVDILAELAPPDLPKHRLDQMAFSMIGQCMYYKLCAPIYRMLLTEKEVADHYSPEQLAEHITDVILAALGHGSLSKDRLKSGSSEIPGGR
ncbi:MAG: TetR/AcrR family transcriptional regulator [Gemmataceae bacterium]